MFNLQRTSFFARSFWKITLLFPRHIVTIILASMALISKVCVSPTKPCSNGTTEFALKFDEICSVYSAICIRHSFCTTTWTNKLRWIILFTIIVLLTFFFPSEIRLFTLKAFIVGESVHCIEVKFLIVYIRRVVWPFVVLHAFKFKPFLSFFSNLLVQTYILPHRWHNVRQDTAYPLFTLGSFSEIEGNPRTHPTIAKRGHYAFVMNYMPTLQVYYRRGA